MGRHPPATNTLDQHLRHHRLQRLRQHRAHQLLLFGGKYIHQAIDGFRRRAGMHRGQHQMPGFRRSQGQANGLRVA
ncbi:hypothetical protein D3C76_1469340 [compost metagenome]